MKKTEIKLTLGSDPELMIQEVASGKMVSALRILKGHDKHDPISLTKGMKCYADNVLIEASFDPYKSVDDIVEGFRKAFGLMQDKLGSKFRIYSKAAHVYAASELRDRRAREAGCTPNYDVYRRKMNKSPAFKDGTRTGSGHIHLGSNMLLDMENKERAIKLLDIFAGCSSILFDKDETSPIRRQLYGKAGEFRPTPYGCEYRPLSNFYLRSPKTVKLVFDLTEHAVSHIDNGTADDVLKSVESDMVEKAINDNNPTLARKVLALAKLPQALLKRVEAEYAVPPTMTEWGF